MLSSLQNMNGFCVLFFFFLESSCEAWFDVVNSLVFKSSSISGRGGVVSCCSSPLLGRERGWKEEGVQEGSLFH